ncbi:MAG: hypothetical protein B6U85_05895 [Desulfurococcales archaeon ex4484_42]|nr:MAG: hypothetical protein B6U85_05895 [Desulfurococcales archaeon ex4484_42]
MRNYNVGIVGFGAIGTLIAYALNKSGLTPYIILRNVIEVKRIIVHGRKLKLPNDEEVKINFKAITYNDVPKVKHFDVIFICTKAYDFSNALNDLLTKLRDFNLIVTCQNGLGTFEYAQERVSTYKVAALVINHGVHKISNNVYKYVGGGESYLGQKEGIKNELVHYVAKLLNTLNITIVNDIEPYRWQKLLINAGINPVTTILKERNEVIIKNEYAKKLALKAVSEGELIAREIGITLPKDPKLELIRIAMATKDNYSSMYQDLILKGRTEIDFINGALVRISKKLNIDAPVNESLYLAVKALELQVRSDRLNKH